MKEREIYNLKSSSKSFLASLFLPQILSLILIMGMYMFYGKLEVLQRSRLYIIAITLIAQVGFALIYFWHMKKHEVPLIAKTKTKFKNLSIKNVLVCVAISVIAIFGLVHFVGLFDGIWRAMGYEAGVSIMPNSTFKWFLVNVVCCCIIPAIVEELLFRNLIYRGLKGLGVLPAVLISAVMFMLVHLSMGSIVYPLIMGVVLALVLEKTGNILYCIIIHFCNNFIVKLIEYINNATLSGIGQIAPNAWWHYALIVIVAIIAIVAIWALIKFVLDKKGEDLKEQIENVETSKDVVAIDDQKSKTYLWVSIAIGFAFWLLIILTDLF